MSKPRLLCWSDFFNVGTGFGTVSKYVIKSLLPYFQIDQLAINYHGSFFDSKEWPVQVVPAKLNNPSDPYGSQMFVNTVLAGNYDYIWIMNDSFIVHKVGLEIPKMFKALADARKKIPKIIYYCPIDCNLQESATGMLKAADRVVAYCEFGKKEILKTLPEVKDKLSVITHGVDPSAFKKISSIDRNLIRSQLLNTEDPETFLWLNVNRNSARKDIARTILAFSEFRKTVPNSKLYLHTIPRDTTIDLLVAVKDLGLSIKTDVLFPAKYSPDNPYPPEVLNSIYNACDAFITTTQGEGWGLTHLDAALVNLPIVAPANTSFIEQLDNGNRGYLYPCKESLWTDNSGYRPVGRLEDIVQTMKDCHNEVTLKSNGVKLLKAADYANSIAWQKIGEHWISLFKELQNSKTSNHNSTGYSSVKL